MGNVKTTDEFTVYEITDLIECPTCKKTLLFDDLEPNEGNTGPLPNGGFWRSKYYTCYECKTVLVYDPGDYSPLRLVKGERKIVS